MCVQVCREGEGRWKGGERGGDPECQHRENQRRESACCKGPVTPAKNVFIGDCVLCMLGEKGLWGVGRDQISPSGEGEGEPPPSTMSEFPLILPSMACFTRQSLEHEGRNDVCRSSCLFSCPLIQLSFMLLGRMHAGLGHSPPSRRVQGKKLQPTHCHTHIQPTTT